MSSLKQAQVKMQEEYKREINGKSVLNASILPLNDLKSAEDY